MLRHRPAEMCKWRELWLGYPLPPATVGVIKWLSIYLLEAEVLARAGGIEQYQPLASANVIRVEIGRCAQNRAAEARRRGDQ